jgi:hypothetical protein
VEFFIVCISIQCFWIGNNMLHKKKIFFVRPFTV